MNDYKDFLKIFIKIIPKYHKKQLYFSFFYGIMYMHQYFY